MLPWPGGLRWYQRCYFAPDGDVIRIQQVLQIPCADCHGGTILETVDEYENAASMMLIRNAAEPCNIDHAHLRLNPLKWLQNTCGGWSVGDLYLVWDRLGNVRRRLRRVRSRCRNCREQKNQQQQGRIHHRMLNCGTDGCRDASRVRHVFRHRGMSKNSSGSAAVLKARARIRISGNRQGEERSVVADGERPDAIPRGKVPAARE